MRTSSGLGGGEKALAGGVALVILAIAVVIGLYGSGVLSTPPSHFVGFAVAKESQKGSPSTASPASSDPALDAVKATVAEREKAWEALLRSIKQTGQDKTSELAGFLFGSPDEVISEAEYYQSGGPAEPRSVSGTPTAPTIQRIELDPTRDMASVIETDEVELSGGVHSQRLLMQTWLLSYGRWYRNAAPTPYWSGGQGKRPVYQGTQVDSMVWAIDHIQELPGKSAGIDNGSLLVVFLDVLNQDQLTLFPSDYTLRLYGPDGAVYDVSSVADSIAPGSQQALAAPLESGEHRSGIVAFEVPDHLDLLSLQFEVVPATSVPGLEDQSGAV